EAGSRVDVIKIADEAAAGDVTITNNSDVQVRSFALEGVLTAANVSGTGTVDIIPTDAGNKFIAVSDYSELAAALANVANRTYVDPVIYCPEGEYRFEDFILTPLTDHSVTILGGGTDKTTFLGFGVDATDILVKQMGLGLYFKLFGDASVDIREIRFKDFARYDTAGNPIVGNYDNYGQGIYVSGGSDNTCSLNVKECAFEGLGGRSFLSVGAGNTTIEDCYFDADDRHYSTINVIEIFGGKKVEVKNSYFKNVLNMDPDWPSTAIAIFDTTGKWDSDSTIEISGCTFDTCNDYCINHELVFNNRAPVPVVKNITYINCEDVIAHIYISNILTEDNPLPEGMVDEIFVVTGYYTYLTYCYYSTDENGVIYENRYYCSGTTISSNREVSSMYVDTEITIGAGKTVTVKDILSIGESATLKGGEGSKLVIADGCITEMTAGTYVWNTESSSWDLLVENS
ncbi:MAG: right-handed parallel beta-helix repeat-containing protein, partial [Candidatus Scatosoma sp.]